MKPKYVICPGMVTSKVDGQRHYVGPMKLMQLYGVDPSECEIYEPASWWVGSFYRMAEERQRRLPRLGPRYDGNYALHNAIAQGPGGSSPAPAGETGSTAATTEGEK
jgi:hypothetical protein